MNDSYLQLRDKPDCKKPNSSSLKNTSSYLGLGFSLCIPLLIGIAVGIIIDSKFDSSPRATIAGITGGFIVTLFFLFSLVKKEQ